MSAFITLELPDALMQAVREEAERTGQPPEKIVLGWIRPPDALFLQELLGQDRVFPIYTPFDNEVAAQQLLDFLNNEPHNTDTKSDL